MAVEATLVFEFHGLENLEDQAGNIIQSQADVDMVINGGIWIDIAEDIIHDSLNISGRGIRGDGPDDRMASVGIMNAELDNSHRCRGGTAGYYSLGHTNMMVGWELGRRVRAGFTYGGTPYYKFTGRLDDVKPIMGIYRERRVKAIVKDYIEELHKNTSTAQLEHLTDVTSDEAYGAALDSITVQPEARDLATGKDVLANVFHHTGGKDASVAEEINRIALSALDYVYIEGDGTFKTQNRFSRLIDTTVQFTLDNTMVDMTIEWSRTKSLDKVKTTIYPTETGTANEIAYELESPIRLNPGESYELIAYYVDPNTGDRVGLTDPVTPVADTHYKFGSDGDGAANDLNNALGIVQDERGGAAITTFTNNGDGVGFVNYYIIQGKLLRVIDKIESVTTVNNPQGNKDLRLNMPYQDRVSFGANVGPMVKNVYGCDQAHIPNATYVPSKSDTLMQNFLNAEIGKRIGIIEDISGVNGEYFINGESWRWNHNKYIEASHVLAPARSGTTATWGGTLPMWGRGYWRLAGG